MRLSLITISILISTTLFMGCGSGDDTKEGNKQPQEVS